MSNKSIPVTILTGFFGVGKTTTIRSLLARKPIGENWAILVNEFGEVPIDQISLRVNPQSEIIISEIPGGCMCCVKNIPMQSAIRKIIREFRPDRLIIEPTGLGHPAGILDELKSPDFRVSIDIRAVICLVDPRFIKDPRITNVGIFRDQVNIADVLIASKADLSSHKNMGDYYAWANTLFPPKLMIGQATKGNIDLNILNLNSEGRRAPLFQHIHGDHTLNSFNPNKIGVTEPKPGHPIIAENRGDGYQACGWIFSRHDKFRHSALIKYLEPTVSSGLEDVERLKGVFRSDQGWYAIDRVRGEINITPVAYRRDSRVEIILPDRKVVDWTKIGNNLIGFLK